MAYYIEDQIDGLVFGERRPTINEYFLSSYSMAVYEAGKKNFQNLVNEGVFTQDKEECLYIYELIMDGRSQNGIVACASVDDYMEGKIKKHELTRPDKEADRKNHVRVSMMNAEPVFFAYPSNKGLDEIVAAITGHARARRAARWVREPRRAWSSRPDVRSFRRQVLPQPRTRERRADRRRGAARREHPRAQ